MSAFVTIAVLAAATSQTAPLPPVGKWNIEYADTACHLSRPYGTTAAPVLLVVRPSLAYSGEQLVLLLPKNSLKVPQRGVATVSPAGSRTQFTYQFASGSVSRGQTAINFGLGEPDFLQTLATAGSVTFNGLGPPITLPLDGIASAVRALRACEKDLLAQWKVDPETLVRLDGGLVLAKWFTRDAYPRNSGRVIAVVDFDSAGRPTECRVVSPSGHAVLNERTCQVAMLRGRLDAAPTRALRSVIVAVRWEGN